MSTQQDPQPVLYEAGQSHIATTLLGNDKEGYTCEYSGWPVQKYIDMHYKGKNVSILPYWSAAQLIEDAAKAEYLKWEETDEEGFDWCLNCLPPLRWEGEEFVQCSECTHLDYYPVVIKVGEKYYKGSKPHSMSPEAMREEVREQYPAA